MPTDLPPADAAPHTRACAIPGVDTGAALRGAGGDAGPLRGLMIPIADSELP